MGGTPTKYSKTRDFRRKISQNLLFLNDIRWVGSPKIQYFELRNFEMVP